MNCCCSKKKEINKLELYLRIIFILNVVILLVIAPYAYFFPNVFEGTSQANLFLIVTGSFWFGILICSFIGIFLPSYMEPIILVQLIYKSLYSIYFAVVWNNYNFRPYGIIFCFNLPWILVAGVYLTLRVVTIIKKKKVDAIEKKEKIKEDLI